MSNRPTCSREAFEAIRSACADQSPYDYIDDLTPEQCGVEIVENAGERVSVAGTADRPAAGEFVDQNEALSKGDSGNPPPPAPVAPTAAEFYTEFRRAVGELLNIVRLIKVQWEPSSTLEGLLIKVGDFLKAGGQIPEPRCLTCGQVVHYPHVCAPTAAARDWPEDFPHENGRYECKCLECGKLFYGHKRRHICRACAGKQTAAAAPTVAEREQGETPGAMLKRLGMDGQLWAKEFAKQYPMLWQEGGAVTDVEGVMLGWFCNAIMAGYDEAMIRRTDAHLSIRADIDVLATVVRTGFAPSDKREWTDDIYKQTAHIAVELHDRLRAAQSEVAKWHSIAYEEERAKAQALFDLSAAQASLAAERKAREEAESLVSQLRRERSEMDCRFTGGNIADVSGSHCPLDNPCLRCRAEKAEQLCNGWMRAALDMAPNCTLTMAFLPDDPAAFAASRVPAIHALEQRAEHAESRLREVEEDAERYQFIRAGEGEIMAALCEQIDVGTLCLRTGAQLDIAIDCARSGGKE